MKYRYAAKSDLGYGRKKMEDYMAFSELDEDTLFCVIADGTGSQENYLQPATMISTFLVNHISEMYHSKPEHMMSDPIYYMKQAMLQANEMIGNFKMANEEVFSGYAASVTCCLLDKDRQIFGASAGNTRLYLIRNGKLAQVTHDHTVAANLLKNGLIDKETYYFHPQRLSMTSGIGLILDPEIEVFKGTMQEKDIVMLSTDGIHYALRPDDITQILLGAGEHLASCDALIEATSKIVKYPDNAAVMIIN